MGYSVLAQKLWHFNEMSGDYENFIGGIIELGFVAVLSSCVEARAKNKIQYFMEHLFLPSYT